MASLSLGFLTREGHETTLCSAAMEIKQADAERAVAHCFGWRLTPRLWGFEGRGFIGVPWEDTLRIHT